MPVPLRDVGRWIVTGLDDIFVERFWTRLKRGEIGAAFRVFPDVILGFSGCTMMALAAALLVVLLVVLL